jgi:hypothetical protein
LTGGSQFSGTGPVAQRWQRGHDVQPANFGVQVGDSPERFPEPGGLLSGKKRPERFKQRAHAPAFDPALVNVALAGLAQTGKPGPERSLPFAQRAAQPLGAVRRSGHA